MKKFFLTILFSFLFMGCTSFDEPTFVPFEKQEVINTYYWSINTINDSEVSLVRYRGKVLFIAFCDFKDPNFEKELELYNKLYEDYKLKVEFLFVMNNYKEKIEGYLNKKEYYLPFYHSNYGAPKPMNDHENNKTFLISKRGRVVMNVSGSHNWNSNSLRKTIDDLLKQ